MDKDKQLFFIMGLLKGKGHIILDGAEYVFTDPNHDGHIVVTEVTDGEHSND